jgi:predicted lipase
MIPVSSKKLAELSQKAYGPNPDIDIDGVEVFFEELGTHLWAVAFTGTQKDHEDILTDLRVFPWYDKDLGWCHSGFLKTTRKVFKPVLKNLNERHALSIVLTGHSLGGARAQVMAALLVHHCHYMASSVKVVTFGSPKVFTYPYRAMMGIEAKRYVFGDDIVTGVPLVSWWKHYSPKLVIGESEGAFEDHRIAGYVEALS